MRDLVGVVAQAGREVGQGWAGLDGRNGWAGRNGRMGIMFGLLPASHPFLLPLWILHL